jgi:hypothetical protein
VAQVLRDPPTDLMAEHFHVGEAHIFDVNVSVVDPLLHEFLRKPIDEWFEWTGIF